MNSPDEQVSHPESHQAKAPGKKTSWQITTLRILSLVFVVSLTVVLFIFRSKISRFQVYGYPGIFLAEVLANATIFLPVPGVLLASVFGSFFNPFWVSIAAGSGAALGELTGYMAGFSGQGVIENRKWYERFERWMKKYGDITILVLAIIPNPVFDMAGMVAGVLRMPLWRFLLWCTVGKIIKMLAFAYFGSYILSLIPWFK
jgi:uncharacterized membrane protein YdjX (TVP38/TMEM64 family)